LSPGMVRAWGKKKKGMGKLGGKGEKNVRVEPPTLGGGKRSRKSGEKAISFVKKIRSRKKILWALGGGREGKRGGTCIPISRGKNRQKGKNSISPSGDTSKGKNKKPSKGGGGAKISKNTRKGLIKSREKKKRHQKKRTGRKYSISRGGREG